MRRGGKLKAAADHRAVQDGDGRHLAELNLLERSMPQVGMRNALRNVALLQFGEIQASGEMLALARDQHRADALRQ